MEIYAWAFFMVIILSIAEVSKTSPLLLLLLLLNYGQNLKILSKYYEAFFSF
jgi:hypothetical protein